jgi:hypothetical protein
MRKRHFLLEYGYIVHSIMNEIHSPLNKHSNPKICPGGGNKRLLNLACRLTYHNFFSFNMIEVKLIKRSLLFREFNLILRVGGT